MSNVCLIHVHAYNGVRYMYILTSSCYAEEYYNCTDNDKDSAASASLAMDYEKKKDKKIMNKIVHLPYICT